LVKFRNAQGLPAVFKSQVPLEERPKMQLLLLQSCLPFQQQRPRRHVLFINSDGAPANQPAKDFSLCVILGNLISVGLFPEKTLDSFQHSPPHLSNSGGGDLYCDKLCDKTSIAISKNRAPLPQRGVDRKGSA
jgi:hypothetical protein